MIENLKKKFLEIFGYESEEEFFSPGRVNLIGEHTDYNGGNVFPCAIDIGTFALVRKREDRQYRHICSSHRWYPAHSAYLPSW